MKLSKGHRTAAKIISIVFFLLAIAGFIHMVNGKFPMINHPLVKSGGSSDGAHDPEAFKAGYYFGAYLKFYILPFVFAYAGWLLYKVGREKPELTIPEEDESKKISE